MANIMHIRARRFQVLYALLTGTGQTDLSRPQHLSDHLMKDMGLPEPHRPEHVSGLLGMFPTDPCKK